MSPKDVKITQKAQSEFSQISELYEKFKHEMGLLNSTTRKNYKIFSEIKKQIIDLKTELIAQRAENPLFLALELGDLGANESPLLKRAIR